jgi:O-antigen/teichoic acid export membrane protein
MRLRDTVGGALAANAGALFLSRVFTSALNFVVLLLLVARFSPSVVGAYYFLTNLLNILGVLIDFGSNTIAAREIARGRPEEEVLGDHLGLRVLLCLTGLVLFTGTILVTESDPSRRLLFLLGAPSLPGFLLGSASVLFQVRHRMVWSAAAAMAGESLFALIAVPVALSSAAEPVRFRWLIAGTALADLVGGGLVFYWASKRVRLRPRFVAARLWALFREAAPQGLAAGAAILYLYLDTVLLKRFRGDHDAGVYNAAYRLFNFFIAPAGMVAAAAFPLLVRALLADAGRARTLYGAVLQVQLAISLGPALILAALAPETVAAVYGRERPEYAAAADALRSLMVAGACVYPAALASTVLVGLGRQRIWTWITAVGLAVNVVANLAVIPRWGGSGAAWATLATEGTVLLLAALAARRLTPAARAPMSPLVRSFAAALAGTVVAVLARPAGFWLAFAAGLAAYGAALATFSAWPREVFRLRSELTVPR